MKVKALRDKLLVHNMKRGERVVNGIILANDNKKEHGIRPRWAQIYDIGEDILKNNINDIKVGQWVLISHGRWSRGVNIPKIDNPTDANEDFDFVQLAEWPDGILAVSDEEPEDTLVKDTYSYGMRTI